MPEGLQNKIRLLGGSIALAFGLVVLWGCGNAKQSRAESAYTEPAMTEESDDSMNQELVQEIAELLGCEEKTALSVFEVLDNQVDGTVVNIEMQENRTGSARKRLIVRDDLNCTYLAVIGSDYLVEKIYRDDETGERIYRIIR